MAYSEAVRTWEIKAESDGQILVVELLKGISPAYRLTVETEKVLETLPATVKIETPHALDSSHCRDSGLGRRRLQVDSLLIVSRRQGCTMSTLRTRGTRRIRRSYRGCRTPRQGEFG